MRKTGPLSTCASNARTGNFRTPLLQRQLDPHRGVGGAEFDAQVPLVPAECRPQMHPTSNLQAAAEALEQASTSDSFWVRVSRGRSPQARIYQVASDVFFVREGTHRWECSDWRSLSRPPTRSGDVQL